MELELRKFQLEWEFKLRELKITNARPPTHSTDHFDVTKHFRLVPPFNEQELDFYFNSFGKVVILNSWPKEKSVALLQRVWTGTARKVYDSLSIEQSSNYDTVKEYILRSYE